MGSVSVCRVSELKTTLQKGNCLITIFFDIVMPACMLHVLMRGKGDTPIHPRGPLRASINHVDMEGGRGYPNVHTTFTT